MPEPTDHHDKGHTEPLPQDIELEHPQDDISDFRWIDLPGLAFFWILMVIVFLQFFTRYILNDSLGWTEEIARYLLIFVGFVGAILGVRKGTHIFLEFFYRFVPTPVAKGAAIVAELITGGFYAFMSVVGAKLAMATGQNMVSIPLPKSTIYWAVSASFAVMTVFSLIWLVHKIRKDSKELVEEIEDHAFAEADLEDHAVKE